MCDKGNVAAVDQLFADHFVDHNPSFGLPGNREGFKRYVSTLRIRFDYHPNVEDLIAESDRVVACLTAQGRLKRKIIGITFIDRQFVEPAIIIWRIAEGKIVERWAT